MLFEPLHVTVGTQKNPFWSLLWSMCIYYSQFLYCLLLLLSVDGKMPGMYGFAKNIWVTLKF